MKQQGFSYFLDMNPTISIAEHEALVAEKNQRITMLEHELAQLKKLIFGYKSERFIPAQPPEQLTLGFESPQAASAEVETEQITYERRRKNHPGRTTLPENIPTEDIVIEPQEDTTGMELIGEEVTETIDYKPGILLKRRYIRKKYARKEVTEGQSPIVIGALPERPIPKGIPEAGLLAHLIVSKYVDHLPFYRQTEMFKRNFGWTIHKTTLNDWFAACCALLDPLYEALIRQVLQTDYLQADESPIRVLESGEKGKSHKGYMWVYRNALNALVLFDYRKGRGIHGPKERLKDYEGYLQVDGYPVYQKLAKKYTRIKLISCLAHIRRKFHEAKDHHPQLANHALEQIQQLYALERTCREENLDAGQIHKHRTEQAKPIFENLLVWANEQQANNLSKGPIGKALHYAKNQLPLLSTYLDDGRIQIDNNLIENAIRPLAVGRKNYLFAGSHQGARRAAMMYSFFASCKTLNINPWEWLSDVLQRIPDHPINQIDNLLPNSWKLNE